MRFWDSSAIVPLCLRESRTAIMKGLLDTDEDMVVWWATRGECLSALIRRQREGSLAADAEQKARSVLQILAERWSEVQPTEVLRRRAERIIAVHPLRSADALQLAGALVWAQHSPQGLEVVCLDRSLREAASKEGFTVLP
jgi:predicted nucleic acid-binding protein